MSTEPNTRTDDRATRLAVAVNDADHVLGPPEAAVTLVEYGDYECPDCLNAFPMVRELREQFQDRLRFVFRHFPLYSIHPHAGVAAQAAEAAAAQGKFWEMHDLLFRNQKRLSDVDFSHLALTIGAELYRFNAELTSSRVLRIVAEHRAGGEKSGVRGTPTFFINGQRYKGAEDVTALADAISAAFRSAR